MKLRPLTFLAFLFPLLILSGCVGYNIGPARAPGFQKIFIPVFTSKVLVPRIEEQITNNVIRAFQLDGSITITRSEDADAILLGEIVGWERQPLRFRGQNNLTAREYRLIITANVYLRDRSGSGILTRRKIRGETTYFVSDDLTAAERQAFPLAAADLAHNIANQIVNRW